MGLDAFVYCRCWQDGVATPPPIGPVGFDDEGYLGLTLPWDGNEAAHTAIEIWLTRACPHEHMKQAHEHVSNWAGLRLFQQVLDDVGWSHFPALHSGLPRANGGSLPAEQASIVLAELDAAIVTIGGTVAELYAHRALQPLRKRQRTSNATAAGTINSRSRMGSSSAME